MVTRSSEANRRIRARQLRRERGSSNVDRSWQKWITCQLCGGSYCCNNYSDRKSRSYTMFGYRCCPTCKFKVEPVIDKLIGDKVLKLRRIDGKKRSHKS
jgi:hypothetical protein